MQNDIVKAINAVMGLIKQNEPETYEKLKGKVSEIVGNKDVQDRNIIFETVKERRKRVGVIVGINDNGTVKIGWSKCNLKLEDKFDQNYGLEVAKDRANKVQPSPALPLCMKRQMTDFHTRCYRYFKDAKTMELVR